MSDIAEKYVVENCETCRWAKWDKYTKDSVLGECKLPVRLPWSVSGRRIIERGKRATGKQCKCWASKTDPSLCHTCEQRFTPYVPNQILLGTEAWHCGYLSSAEGDIPTAEAFTRCRHKARTTPAHDPYRCG